jgi:hypothetical protein
MGMGLLPSTFNAATLRYHPLTLFAAHPLPTTTAIIRHITIIIALITITTTINLLLLRRSSNRTP